VGNGPADAPSGVRDGHFDDVVAAARRGDEQAIAELFVELHPRLLRFLGARSGHAGEDLAGDVWMAVAKRIGRFDGLAAHLDDRGARLSS